MLQILHKYLKKQTIKSYRNLKLLFNMDQNDQETIENKESGKKDGEKNKSRIIN